MERRSYRKALLLGCLAGMAVVFLALALLEIPYVSTLAGLALGGIGLLLLLWLLWRGLRAFLWKVGRRLAFSYFLIGVLPIPMTLLLMGILAYLLAGLFLGHLYQDAVSSLRTELRQEAEEKAEELTRSGRPGPAFEGNLAFGYYRQGRRIGGDSRTPMVWPAWAEKRKAHSEQEEKKERDRLFALPNQQVPTFAMASGNAGRAGQGVIAVYTGRLDQELSRRSDFWVELNKAGDEGLRAVELVFWKIRIPLLSIRKDHAEEAEEFFEKSSRGHWFWDGAMLWWGEIHQAPLSLATGQPASGEIAVTVNGTPRILAGHLQASASEFDARVWASLLILAALMVDIYLVATIMAVVIIFSLSRAVNRLSTATEAVQQGDFSVRIPVRRKDQVGELQTSFNEMAANLEMLVAAAAQKELIDKELALARDLQMSLVPAVLPSGSVECATLFEPSAAIGGDYFDMLRLPDGNLAVFIADVSGHGLTAGLRMAMLKAALGVLVEETRDPGEILRRLDGVVRSDGRGRRSFVTATLALLDLQTGHLHLTNAGHPPTYRVRRGQVEEILLPGSPLGGLGHNYGQATVLLAPGDVVIWLSDGLIEAVNPADEPFGYEGVVKTLSGIGEGTAAEARDRLLADVEAHAAGQPFGDDRTLVVMRWLG